MDLLRLILVLFFLFSVVTAMPVSLPPTAYLTLKNGSTICRVISGMWQLSGHHGFKPSQAAALLDMRKMVDFGFTTFDLADHYGPAEDFVGAFKSDPLGRSLFTSSPVPVQFHTKWVPRSGDMSLPVVRSALDVSRRRMQSETLDLVAFHWWDYDDKRYLDLLQNAQILTMPQADGSPPYLSAVSLTNFDTVRLKEIVSSGVNVVSNQVSFSVLDTRPIEFGMASFSAKHGIHLLVYGSLLGGLLSDKWVGKPAPSKADLDTASLNKYFGFVRQWGSWSLFQELLSVLQSVGRKYGKSVSQVSVRWVLQQEGVGAAILGMRLGHTAAQHIDENKGIFEFELDAVDLAEIKRVQDKGKSLALAYGDCGGEYRG